MKKFVSIVLAVIMTATSLSMASYAVDYDTPVDEVIIDEYAVFSSLSTVLSINNGTASYSSAGTISNRGTITITHSLEKYSGWFWIWDPVSNSGRSKSESNTTMLTLNSTYSGLTSGKYRVKSVFTVTTNTGSSETVTIYSSEKTIS